MIFSYLKPRHLHVPSIKISQVTNHRYILPVSKPVDVLFVQDHCLIFTWPFAPNQKMLFANQAPTKPNLSNHPSHVGKVCTQKAPQNSACTCKIFRRLRWKIVYNVCASISQQTNQHSMMVTVAGVYATMS